MAQKRKGVDVDEIGAAATCANGCGFFGSAATGGMCSKCYREHTGAAVAGGGTTATTDEKMQSVFKTSVFAPAPRGGALPEKKARITFAPSPDGAAGADDNAAAAEAGPATAAAEEQPAKTAAAAPSRCRACRKKVGLLGFRCYCGETFCGAHRYAEAHACGFDYKGAARERIAKNNPVVVADKIAMI